MCRVGCGFKKQITKEINKDDERTAMFKFSVLFLPLSS